LIEVVSIELIFVSSINREYLDQNAMVIAMLDVVITTAD
jgi:hypothetical protein